MLIERKKIKWKEIMRRVAIMSSIPGMFKVFNTLNSNID